MPEKKSGPSSKAKVAATAGSRKPTRAKSAPAALERAVVGQVERLRPPPSGDGGMVSRIGPVEIDWPRSLGYFGGAVLAVAFGVVDPPVGVLIAAIPFIKMLDLSRAPRPSQIIGQVFDGLAKPIGGDSQGTVRLVTSEGTSNSPVGSSSG